MQVRLTRKLAETIDGVDLSRRVVGDVLDLPQREAQMLLAEGWASPAALTRSARRAQHPADLERRHARSHDRRR
jgi:hypothetical protein